MSEWVITKWDGCWIDFLSEWGVDGIRMEGCGKKVGLTGWSVKAGPLQRHYSLLANTCARGRDTGGLYLYQYIRITLPTTYIVMHWTALISPMGDCTNKVWTVLRADPPQNTCSTCLAIPTRTRYARRLYQVFRLASRFNESRRETFVLTVVMTYHWYFNVRILAILWRIWLNLHTLKTACGMWVVRREMHLDGKRFWSCYIQSAWTTRCCYFMLWTSHAELQFSAWTRTTLGRVRKTMRSVPTNVRWIEWALGNVWNFCRNRFACATTAPNL